MLFPGCGEAVSRKASRWARHLQITTYCPEPVLHQARKQKQHFPRQQSKHPQAPPPRPQETLSAFSRLSCDPTSDWWDEAQGCYAAGCECSTRGAGSAPGKPSSVAPPGGSRPKPQSSTVNALVFSDAAGLFMCDGGGWMLKAKTDVVTALLECNHKTDLLQQPVAAN